MNSHLLAAGNDDLIPCDGSSEVASNGAPCGLPVQTCAELRSMVLDQQSAGAALLQIAVLAAKSIPGADEASVTMVHEKRLHSVEFSGRLGVALDERQYPTGFGPSLEVARTGQPIAIDTTAHCLRFPDFADQANHHGIGHILSLRLCHHQDLAGVLTIYGESSTPFDVHTRNVAQTFASQADTSALNCMIHALVLEETHQLRQALSSRAGIEQAKGMVMRELSCSPDHAFNVLKDMSSRTGRKVRDIAQEIIRPSAPPTAPSRPHRPELRIMGR
jgi:hypothetical protein